jgi:putative nucleotidyltransferase with HDIG domain
MAGIAQLGDVELFSNSRSRIYVSGVIAIAAILLFGPMAGALTHLFSGLMTAITTTLRSAQPEIGRVSWTQRSLFNTSMLVISISLAGWVYTSLGGQTGAEGSAIDLRPNLVPLICAVTVDTLSNLAILVCVIALQTGRRPSEIWKQDFSWGIPVNVLGGILGGGALVLAYQMLGVLGGIVFYLPILATSYSFRLYVSQTKGYVDKLEEMNHSLDEINMGLLETLAAIIDADDVYTSNHSRHVAVYASAIAEKMNLSQEQQTRIRKAGLVHDVGKVGISDSIIGKQDKLREDEFNIIKRHPLISAEIIGSMQGFHDIVSVVRAHHERWDGRGYPDGLKGEEIPLEARIIALADALEAMLSDRPYRRTRSFKEILDEIERCSGTQFDPAVVKAFFAVVEEKDRGFFANSAALVDRSVLLAGLGADATDARYLKRGMME